MQAEFLLKREKSRQLDIYTVKNQAYRVHFHSHIEVCLVLDGEIEVWINDQRSLLKAGQLAVAWSYDTHGYHTPEYSKALSAIIPPQLFQEFQPILRNRHTNSPFLSDPTVFRQIHEWCVAAKASQDNLIRKGYIYLILGTLIKHMEFEEAPASGNQQLASQALVYLSEHFREPLDLNTVARHLGYHPTHLSYMFKNTLQVGFNQYLTLLRLRESLLLLQEGKKSMTECAFESGFQSLRTFYRVFRQTVGCSPREYVAKNLSQAEK